MSGARNKAELYAELMFAMGWIGALLVQCLISVATYDQLAIEFEAISETRSKALEASQAEN